MEYEEPYSEPSAFAELIRGPLPIFLSTLILAIGIFHLLISLQHIFGRRGQIPAGLHLILLFSGPCLVFLFLLSILPTILPYVFINGIDASEAMKSTLRCTSALSWLCLGSFLVNLLLSVATLVRNKPATPET